MSEEQAPCYAKQVIVVRKDLRMKAGKLAAQVSHASMAPLTTRLRMSDDARTEEDEENEDTTLSITFWNGDEHDDAFLEWIEGSFTKVVLEIETEQELIDLLASAEEEQIPAFKIEDEGRTAFHGVKTLTCASFGPCYSDVFDRFTGHLKLYNVKG